ncbi:MAG: RNA methyltransferase [Acidimicrobiia bacterium]|jgi:TrmH family RNA methyltransferase|nr:RNA methyltransferase [Acidimicrobiia bacterium]
MEPVRSTRNPRVIEAIRLHRARRRAETGDTLLEGLHLLEEALRAGAPIKTVFVCEGDEVGFDLVDKLESVVVTDVVMKRLAGTQNPRGPVGIMTIPPDEQDDHRSLMVSWGVGDPGNVGTLIRSAAAFGLAFLSGPGTADPWSPKVLRAAAGSHFRTAIERRAVLSVGMLQARGFTVVASVVEGGDPPDCLAGPGRFALVVGEEGSGLPIGVVREADLMVTIPMPGHTESLNVAVAGSLLAYELASRRTQTT